jgi:uncharacterized SAM-binding protein YcdF (DUF218 family)
VKRAAVLCSAVTIGLVVLAGSFLRVWPAPAMFDAVSHQTATRLVDILESRFTQPQIRDWSRVTGLIVLGGAPQRFSEAIRLAAAHPHLRVVISGASAFEMELIARADPAIQQRLIFETKSLSIYKNTFGNAVFSRELVGPVPGERWLLVTSASHMPRAIGTFHRIEFPVEAWPVRVNSDNLEYLAYIARHEWLGLVSYWLRGRTTAFLPGTGS